MGFFEIFLAVLAWPGAVIFSLATAYCVYRMFSMKAKMDSNVTRESFHMALIFAFIGALCITHLLWNYG